MQTSNTNTAANTIEEFSPLPFGEDTTATSAPVHQFQGKPLFPYSEGIRMLFGPMLPPTADPGTWLLGLTFLLADLQASVDAGKAKRLSDDDAQDLAFEEVLRTRAENPRAFHAGLVRRAGKLSRVDVQAGVALAETILRQYEAGDEPATTKTAPDAPEPVSAVVTPETEKPRTAGRGRGKATAKTGEAVAGR